MNSRKYLGAVLPAAGMMVLILDAKTALAGMISGIELCLKTLIPSLFPYFILSIILTGNILGSRGPFLRPIGRLCGIPEGAESLLAVGLLGGYPVGAQNVAMAFRGGSLLRSDAERMVVFCNNAGPAFLFGMIGSAFDSPWAAWALWGIHILSALVVALAVNLRMPVSAAAVPVKTVTVTQALRQALAVMAQVCGWVMLFRTILAYLDRWFGWLFSDHSRVVLSGILELSNGCVQLRSIECEGMRFITASALLALGGLCVLCQTSSVTQGLSLRYYFPGKILQASVSVLMSFCLQHIFAADKRYILHPVWIGIILLSALISLYFLQKGQKSSSIPLAIGV